jgi:ubiquinone/menaquinone biosynthesis C-methylase UbiE
VGMVNRVAQVVSVYDKVAQKYAKTFSKIGKDPDWRFLKAFLKILPHRFKVLDAGCGPGTYAKELQKRSFGVEGVDLSRKMIRLAKAKYPGIKFRVMDVRQLKYSARKFDAAIAAYIFQHLTDADATQALSELNRVLKNKGLLFIAVHQGRGGRIVKEPLDSSLKIYVRLYTREKISKLLEKAGFKVIKVMRRPHVPSLGEFPWNRLFMIAQKIEPYRLTNPEIIKKVGFDFHWSNSRIWKIKTPVTEMQIKKLEWMLDIPFLDVKKGRYNLTPAEFLSNPKRFKTEYQRTMNADLRYPIDLMLNKGRWLVLDGLHRLMKAKIIGWKKVNVRKIPRSKIKDILKLPPVEHH